MSDQRRARLEMGAAVAACAVAGALALSAAGQTWVRITALRPAPLPPVGDALSGGQVASLVPATGLLLLAAAVALFAVRGPGRIAVGLAAAVAGGALIWSGLRPLVGGASVTVADLTTAGRASVTAVRSSVSAGWPVLTVVAGVLAVLAGALVVLRGRAWPAMGRRYDRPHSRGATTPAPEATDDERATAAWQALDRGEDPTAT